MKNGPNCPTVLTTPAKAVRWAIYRDSLLTGPSYLGDVLATDRDAAERLGAATYGGAVLAQRTASREPSPALERALRSVTKRDARRGAR